MADPVNPLLCPRVSHGAALGLICRNALSGAVRPCQGREAGTHGTEAGEGGFEAFADLGGDFLGWQQAVGVLLAGVLEPEMSRLSLSRLMRSA